MILESLQPDTRCRARGCVWQRLPEQVFPAHRAAWGPGFRPSPAQLRSTLMAPPTFVGPGSLSPPPANVYPCLSPSRGLCPQPSCPSFLSISALRSLARSHPSPLMAAGPHPCSACLWPPLCTRTSDFTAFCDE